MDWFQGTHSPPVTWHRFRGLIPLGLHVIPIFRQVSHWQALVCLVILRFWGPKKFLNWSQAPVVMEQASQVFHTGGADATPGEKKATYVLPLPHYLGQVNSTLGTSWSL